MTVYPSPSHGDVWVEMACPGVDLAPRLAVWDAMGRRLELPVEVEMERAPLFKYRLNGEGLAAGIYVVQLEGGSIGSGGTISRKWMVE